MYTLGRHGQANNMLLGEEQLQAIGASIYRTDRGGDITYHGPGQLVCYVHPSTVRRRLSAVGLKGAVNKSLLRKRQ